MTDLSSPTFIGGAPYLFRPIANLGLPTSIKSAMLAPAAMLAGAAGLMGVWGAASLWPMPLDAGAPPAAQASPRQVQAVRTALSTEAVRLSGLLGDLGAPVLTQPTIQLTATAAQTAVALRQVEADMVTAADQDARDRMRAAQEMFRSAGLDARGYAAVAPPSQAISPLELRNPQVLAAKLDLDTGLARTVERTAHDLITARAMTAAAAALPLAEPVDDPVRSSPFGTRTDPFTGEAAFHPGQDFSGHYGQAIHVTAPGVVSFVGQRSGYGNCVEVDHGYGLKTRYGHLSAFVVGVGTPVKTGDVIGRMGSTGRSTGVHLHYEVWVSGRLQDPARFLKAGDLTRS